MVRPLDFAAPASALGARRAPLSFDEPDRFGGAAMNATAGANETLYAIAGAPVDIVRGAMNLAGRGINAVTGADIPLIPENSFGGSRFIAETLGAVRPELDPRSTEATTAAERIARSTGQGVAGTILPAGIVGGLARTGTLGAQGAEIGARIAGRSNSVRAAGADAVAGAAGGAGASAAMEVTPDRYDPLSGLVGGLVGGGLGALATGIPGLARETARATRDFSAPLSEGGRQRLAAERLRDGATDAGAARASLDAEAAPLVPGSNPTTGQVTGDMGQLAMERAAQSRDPAAFQQRRADQNTARREAMDAIQPSGSAETVTRALRQRLADIDREATEGVDITRQTAQQADRAIGQSMRPEDAGDVLRENLSRRRDLAVEKERRLWAAVDPDGTFALPPQDTRRAATSIMTELPKSARPPSAEEAAIYAVVGQYGDVMTFREVSALRSRVSQAAADERSRSGKSPSWARLIELRGAIESDLENAVSRRVAVEERAVAAGQMREQDTLEAALRPETEAWVAEQGQIALGGNGSQSARGNRASGPQGIFGAAGTEVPSFGQSVDAARDPRLSPVAGGAGARAATDPGAVARDGTGTGLGAAGAGGGRVPGSPELSLRSGGGSGVRSDLPPAGTGGQGAGPTQAPGDPGLSRVSGGEAGGGLPGPVGSFPALPAGTRVVSSNGPLGPSVDGFQDRWQDAVSWLSQARTGDAIGVLSHPQLSGRIDVVWGTERAGLAKIVARHPEVLRDLPERLQRMQIIEQPGNRIVLASADGSERAVISQDYEGASKQWLLTAYERGEGRPASSLIEGASGLRAADPSSPPRPADHEYRPFDDQAKGRLDRATEATRQRADTFDGRQIAPMLARPTDHASFNMESARVASRAFTPGAAGFERMQAVRRALGPNSRKAMGAIESYAIDSLRKAAMGDDGLLDPAKVDRWRRAHSDALRAFPELDIRIGNAADASETAFQFAASRKTAIEDAQRGAVGRLIGVEDPQDVSRIVGGLFGRQDSVQQLAQLRRAVGDDKEALQGLRRAAADFLSARLISNTEAATSGRTMISADQMQTFVRQNKAALRTIFSAEEVGTLDAIAADLQRANRSLNAVRIPGQSNTVQDALAVTSGDTATSILGKLMTAGMASGGALAGLGVGNGVGAVLGAGGGALIGALRQNGIQRVDELVTDALLNPNRARMLLATVPPKAPAREEAMWRSLARRYAKASVASAAVASGSNDQSRPTAPAMPQITVTPVQLDPLADAMMELR